MYFGSMAPVSNRADWYETVEIIDDELNEAVDLTDAELTLEVRDQESEQSVLRATVGSGITLSTETGKFDFLFARASMTAVCPGTYDVGLTITRDGETEQLFIGTVPIHDGVVSR